MALIERGIGVIKPETDKIDSAPTDGLIGIPDSIAYRLHEVETHIHSWGRSFGLAAVPVGEIHRADFDMMLPFVMNAGNNTWGNWLQILGSSDTPFEIGKTHFDLRNMIITDVQYDKTMVIIQISCGESGPQSIIDYTYTSRRLLPQKDSKQVPFEIQTKRNIIGDKIWARCWVNGQNGGTVDFFCDLHEYPG